MAPVLSGFDHPRLRLDGLLGNSPREIEGHSWARTFLDYSWKIRGSCKMLLLSEDWFERGDFLEQDSDQWKSPCLSIVPGESK